jgi:hypothetical protein
MLVKNEGDQRTGMNERMNIAGETKPLSGSRYQGGPQKMPLENLSAYNASNRLLPARSRH